MSELGAEKNSHSLTTAISGNEEDSASDQTGSLVAIAEFPMAHRESSLKSVNEIFRESKVELFFEGSKSTVVYVYGSQEREATKAIENAKKIGKIPNVTLRSTDDWK
jgi:hypothetical protein